MLNQQPTVLEQLSRHRAHAAAGTAIGFGIGFSIKPLAALCLIIAMALNSL